jgi:glutathionylspermidine synthase
MVLSNKAILPLLWELFPNHPNLLPAYTEPEGLKGSFVKKPVFSREGANIELYQDDQTVMLSTDGPYNQQQVIYQALCPLPCFNSNYTVVGSWIVGGKSVGIGIREDDSLITKNTSRFVPHCVV